VVRGNFCQATMVAVDPKQAKSDACTTQGRILPACK
jgi:hypothetical protein